MKSEHEPALPAATVPGHLPAGKEITEQQATMLAHLLHEIRPEWAITSMLSLLWEHRARAPFPELCEAAIKVARNPAKRTPGVIFMDGHHWATTPGAHPAPANGPPCEDHPEEQAHNCRCCAADIKTGQRPAHLAGKHHEG